MKLDLFTRGTRGQFSLQSHYLHCSEKKSLSTRSASKVTLHNSTLEMCRAYSMLLGWSALLTMLKTTHAEIYQSWTPEPSSILEVHSHAMYSVLFQVHLDNIRWQPEFIWGGRGSLEVKSIRWNRQALFESNTAEKVTLPRTVCCLAFHDKTAHELLNKSCHMPAKFCKCLCSQNRGQKVQRKRI